MEERDGVGNLRAGELHYWRLDPRDWPRALEAMAELGFDAVSTCVPWSIHERAAGRYDFSGPLDAGGFLDAAADAGLTALVRLDPHVNAELTLFGLPERVLAREECRALTAAGAPAWLPAPPRMFPIPSFASAAFVEEASAWLAAAIGEVGERLDRLVIDAELAMFGRTGAFDLDYHPDALTWWGELHGDLEPPRAYDRDRPDLGARWVSFKEQYARRAREWIDAAIDCELPRLDSGRPIPVARESLAAARERGLALAGSIADVAVGAPAYVLPPDPASQASAAIAVAGSGACVFRLEMAVDRDRWTDAAIGPDGAPRVDWVAPYLAALADLDGARARPLVGVIESRADRRYAVASSVLDPAPPLFGELLDAGTELALDSEARDYARWSSAIADALDALEISWARVDEATDGDELARFALVVCPTVRRIDAGLWQRLRAIAAGGTRVVLGPGIPEADAFGAPLDDTGLVANMGLLRDETDGDLEALGDDLMGALPGQLDDLWIAPEDPTVSCAPLWSGDQLRGLVVINTGDDPCDARIAADAGMSFRDALDGSELQPRNETLVVALEPQSARLLLCAQDP